MQADFITAVCEALQQAGYAADPQPRIPGVQALLYARARQTVQLAFARVDTHLLFVDWDNSAFGRLEQIKAIYARFSAFANQGYRVPHGLRMTIPNLALVAVANGAFPLDAVSFAQSSDFNPWYGGEVGQLILVEMERRHVISLQSLGSGRFPRPGALPLGHASRLVREVCERGFAEQRAGGYGN